MPLRDLRKESPSSNSILIDLSCSSTSSTSCRVMSPNGYAPENTLNAVSLSTPPDMVMAMSWLATTESGHGLPSQNSSSLESHRLAMTRASATSSGAVAMIFALMCSPILCPARPALWIMRDTCLGELYWMTMSVEPTSIPSSSDDVHISDLISPFLKRSSMSMRFSLDRDPWCTSIDIDSSHRW